MVGADAHRRELFTAAVTIAALACAAGGCSDADDEQSGRTQAERRPPAPERMPEAGSDVAPVPPGASNGTGRSRDAGAEGTGETALRNFGQRPGRADAAAITRVVRQYNAALSSGDKARACALSSSEAKRMFKSTPAESGRAACLRLFTLWLPQYTAKAKRQLSRARVTRVRLKGRHALAVFTMPGPHWSMLPMTRDGTTWKIGAYGAWSKTG